MSKRKLTVIFSIILGTVLTVCAMFTASAFSDNDPLITLSYLQEIFAPALKQEIVSEIGEKTPAVNNSDAIPAVPENSQDPSANTAQSYTLIQLTKGQTVMANSICEFIVRPGSHVAVISPFDTQGIADITNGTEILADCEIPINAYCLIPRGADGRGLRVTGENAYIMIRGDYTIG